jgi:hypothetical protein
VPTVHEQIHVCTVLPYIKHHIERVTCFAPLNVCASKPRSQFRCNMKGACLNLYNAEDISLRL